MNYGVRVIPTNWDIILRTGLGGVYMFCKSIIQVTYQRDEVRESQCQVNRHGLIFMFHRSQLLVVAALFKQVVDQTLFFVSAAAYCT